MTSENSLSLSKGCFVYKGKAPLANKEDYLPASNDKFVKSRLKLNHLLQKDLHARVNKLRSDLNSKMFEELITFTTSSYKKNHVCTAVDEIPTAVLITGVNTPDHDAMFLELEDKLRKNVTPLVAHLTSKDCIRLAMLVQNIFQQLTNVSAPLDDAGGDEGEEEAEAIIQQQENHEFSPVQLKTVVKHRKATTMSTLVKWYVKNYRRKTQPSPVKKLKTTNSSRKELFLQDMKANSEEGDFGDVKKVPPMIVMLEDAENINPIVLQDFISLCSSHLTSVPFVLILGIATSLTVIHQLLPTSVSSLLCIEKFQAPSASSYLTQLMDTLIMTSDMPFKLGPKVFHCLLDNFLYHDFSILNFIMGVELSMSEHFLWDPLSLLCCYPSEVDTTTARLTHAQLEDIRRQPAFMRYVESKQGPNQAKLLTDDSATKNILASELKELHLFHAQLFAALKFLFNLCSDLPKHPLGRQKRELYSICLTQELCKSEAYEQAFSYLRMMSCDQLCQLLMLANSAIADVKDELPGIQRLYQTVGSLVYRLQNLDEETDDEDDVAADNIRILPQRAKLHELKEKLQSMSSTRKMSTYERLRNIVLNTLHEHFLLLLVCPSSRPLHQVVYFNNLAAIKDQIKAAPRCSIQRSLVQPDVYLGCACCQCNPEDILPSMPDICIVYKLHLECGTLVNLYDWQQAFTTVVNSNEAGNKRKVGRKQKLSDELRARFIRAVSELQFLGFIKGTQRKTDHVTRLTW